VTVTLDLGPAIALQKRLSSGAFFTGLTIYLEAVVLLVLLTETAFSLPFLVPIGLVLGAQIVLVREPVRLLVRDRLVANYIAFLCLGLVFIALTALGSRGGEPRAGAAALLSALVVGATAWPAIATIRAARACRGQLRGVANPAALLACLSFAIPAAISRRVRAFGGDRKRSAAPFVVAIVVGASCLLALALLQQALGLELGALIGQAAGLAALWVFYRTMRYAKPRASELRARDTRPPVLILREFGDDGLATARFTPGRSFEHFFTAELDRIGPTISVGRPGERLAPLGASRDYLDSADWKRVVGTMIEDAAVITFLLGDSENLLWEFRRTIETRGRTRVLVIVPPVSNQAEVRRRWAHFVHATADIVGPGLPGDLPEARVLAFAFAGEDIVLFVTGGKRRSPRSWFSKVPIDYRLALRLFGCLLPAQPASAAEVEAFVRGNFPLVQVRGAPL
jgi:hypothetical protein